MRKFVLLLFLFSASSLFAQEVGTFGTDFWLAFMSNWHDTDHDTYKVSVSGPRSCTVTITNPISGWSQTLSVTPNTIASTTIVESQCWQSGSCVIRDKGLHITSTDSVQVYAFNHSSSNSSCDAVTLFTTSSLGSEYIVDTYPFTASTDDARAQFSILAIHDNTTINIAYNGATSTGVASGTTQSIVLDSGQVYQVQSPSGSGQGNFTGTVVTSQNCVPFALFMGNSVTNVPATNTNSSDHTFSQALPTKYWSSDWALVPAMGHNLDCVRVIAKADSTIIFRNGTPVTIINRGQAYEFTLTTAIHLTTSKPCQVVQYLDSRHSGGVGSDHGDAASFVPNALNTTTKKAVFPSYTLNNHSGYSTNYYVNIVFPTSESSLLMLDGSAITGSSATVPGTTYSYLRVSLTNGSHTLSTTGTGFIAHAYGLAEDWEAYVMSLGGNTEFEYNNEQHPDTVEVTACTVPFEYNNNMYYESGEYLLETDCHFELLILNFASADTIDVDTVVCGSSYRWQDSTISASGDYLLYVSHNQHGCDSSILLHLQLYPTYDKLITLQSCDSLITFQDSSYLIPDEGLDIRLEYQSIFGCDSIVTYHIILVENIVNEITYHSCVDSLYPYMDTLLTIPGDYSFTYTSVLGCDSIVTLHLMLSPSYEFTTVDSVTRGQWYQWIGGYRFNTDIDTAVIYHTTEGCDSIYNLHLKVIQPSTPEVWVPDVFTPNRSDNQVFKVLSKEVDEMTVYIYHRWGDCIYSFDGLREVWDGTHKGRPCPQAAYVYQIRYHVRGSQETPKPISGTVLLLR